MKKQERPKLNLLHPEFKSIHFFQAARFYITQKKLTEKKRIAFEERIIKFAHPYVLMLQSIVKSKHTQSKQKISNQVLESKKPKTQTELIRRIKISYRNTKQSNELFAGFWKFLSKQLSLHSHHIGTEAQQQACRAFELKIHALF